MRDRVVLGNNAQYSADMAVTGVNNNVVVCGGTGSGKTMSVTEPRLLNTFDSSLIVTMTKKRLVKQYRPLFRKRGYSVQVLNFADPAHSTVCYDPLKYITGYADIRFLASAIVKCGQRDTVKQIDPYWDNAAISLLCALIAYVLTMEDDATFADVLDLFHEMEISDGRNGVDISINGKFEMLEQLDPSHYAVKHWRSFRSLPIRTSGCVYSTLSAAIETVFTPDLEQMMRSRRNIRFEDIADKKTVLFVVTSPVNPALHTFVNMFYAQAFKELFEIAEESESGALNVPVHVLCDDFATGSRIVNFPEYISIFREKKISVTLLIQSESQLASIYGDTDATTIINNCDTYVFLGGMDLKTARSISERMNVPLDEVLYMPVGQEYVFRRGQKPVRTKRYDILSDSMYRELYGLNENQEIT